MKFAIWIIILILIFVRYFLTKPKFVDGDKVRITSIIYSDPIIYEKSQYIRLAGLKVYLPLFPEVYFGDKIVVEGVINNNRLDKPKLVRVVDSKNYITDFRNNTINYFNRNLPQPESGLLSGILLGSKGSLTQDFYTKTKLAGVAHVVVASGTNITFVINFLMAVLILILPRRKAIYFVILGIILYLFVSGFEAPLIRASIMSGIVFFTQETGRIANSWRILFMTAGGMLVFNPIWITDVGFILSFASTMSLMLFQNKINEKLLFLPAIIRESVSTSLAAQIGVSPILFVVFRQFNIFSVIVNALVLWTIPIIMALGALSILLRIKVLLYLTYPYLWWFTNIVTLFTS